MRAFEDSERHSYGIKIDFSSYYGGMDGGYE
jgi:hypothetical protein